jgi:hypothetical protein
MVEKMSTENRFSEDKDKPFAGACAATEWKIPSTKTISARAKSISEITYSSAQRRTGISTLISN